MPPADFLRMLERIATVDGSAAWVAAFGSANTYMASLPIETQRVIYATGPDQVFAGGLYPAQKASAVPGGCQVSGRWRFASGCMGADWIGVGIEVDGPAESGRLAGPAASAGGGVAAPQKSRSCRTGTWSACRAPAATTRG